MAPGHGYARTCEAIPRRHEEAAPHCRPPDRWPLRNALNARPSSTVRCGHCPAPWCAPSPGPRTDALHGVPFGQPAHPALVRLPLGCWTSAVLLDLFRGSERASGTLVAAGLAAALPAGGHRARRLVRAAPSPAAGWAGARDIAGRRHHAVRRLAAGQGDRAVRERQGAVGRRAGARHRRRLPWRAPGAATRRWRQPRRADRPPRRPGLARPLPAEELPDGRARPAPARLPEPAAAARG